MHKITLTSSGMSHINALNGRFLSQLTFFFCQMRKLLYRVMIIFRLDLLKIAFPARVC